MRTTLTVLGVYVLALLLASSVPVGASDPVHGGALLHAALPHVHPGSALTTTLVRHPLPIGSVIEAGASTATEIPSSGLTPPVPHTAVALIAAPEQRLRLDIETWPEALREAPPDRPPTSLLPA